VNPFFFGDTGSALYGVHHPPRGSTPRASGVVLCYPFAQEYMRAHRAFRQLSLLLSGEGFHTLRFDYSGTGDSYGEPQEMSVANWETDLATAIEELMDSAAVDSVWLVGLRLGAALALRASSRPEVRGVILWDPIVSGHAQLADAHGVNGDNGKGVLELGGIPIVPRVREDLKKVDLLHTPIPGGLQTMLAVCEDTAPYQSLRDRLTRDGAQVTYTCIPSDGRWSEFDNWGSALIPQALIRAIVDYLKRTVK
jgi:pimeloyl-ACP methyl ester carboxylesterase